jgi:diguanylate cyclase (GGDEF)-like protein
MEYRVTRRDGREVWVQDEAYIVPDDRGRPLTLRGILVDITERKRLEEQLAHQAFYDALTGLANRALFTDRAHHALAGAGRRGGSVVIMMMDLNGFKGVNDTLGHGAGDRVLEEFARRLRDALRPGDTAARVGGDEFALLLEEAALEDAAGVAGRVLGRAKEPFDADGREVFLDVSIGIAEGRDPGGLDLLMRNADAAMYAAKREGKGGYQVYREESHAEVIRLFELSSDLRRAVERREFTLHYQPIVTLPRGEVVGVEALVRWLHPERGLILPDGFIPLAEETGLVVEIDRWVLQEACRQARSWQRRFPAEPPLNVAVNFSARQLHHEDLIPNVKEALRDSGLEPSSLTVEITEGALLRDVDATIAGLQGLRELGVRVAIDDFGVGFSSLNYIRRLPVDVVKIDRSFVAGVATAAEEWGLARGIVKLVQGLGLVTVAEGIETPEQVAHLQALGCHLGQGFYFARPAEPEAISELLARAGEVRGLPFRTA